MWPSDWWRYLSTKTYSHDFLNPSFAALIQSRSFQWLSANSPESLLVSYVNYYRLLTAMIRPEQLPQSLFEEMVIYLSYLETALDSCLRQSTKNLSTSCWQQSLKYSLNTVFAQQSRMFFKNLGRWSFQLSAFECLLYEQTIEIFFKLLHEVRLVDRKLSHALSFDSQVEEKTVNQYLMAEQLCNNWQEWLEGLDKLFPVKSNGVTCRRMIETYPYKAMRKELSLCKEKLAIFLLLRLQQKIVALKKTQVACESECYTIGSAQLLIARYQSAMKVSVYHWMMLTKTQKYEYNACCQYLKSVQPKITRVQSQLSQRSLELLRVFQETSIHYLSQKNSKHTVNLWGDYKKLCDATQIWRGSSQKERFKQSVKHEDYRKIYGDSQTLIYFLNNFYQDLEKLPRLSNVFIQHLECQVNILEMMHTVIRCNHLIEADKQEIAQHQPDEVLENHYRQLQDEFQFEKFRALFSFRANRETTGLAIKIRKATSLRRKVGYLSCERALQAFLNKIDHRMECWQSLYQRYHSIKEEKLILNGLVVNKAA